MDTLGPKPYQARAMEKFVGTVETNGKTVLEIGGSNLPEEFIFEQTGCEKYIAVDLLGDELRQAVASSSEASPHPNEYVNHLRRHGIQSLRDVGDSWPSASFQIYGDSVHDLKDAPKSSVDCIFSVAAFEHIPQLADALDVMYDVLKPGGILWSEFSPIWSSREGHHYPIYTRHLSEEQISRGEGKLPPFGHVLMNEDEAKTYLLDHYTEVQANEAIYGIYQRDYVNRMFYSDYMDALAKCKFTDFVATPFDTVNVEPELAKALEKKYPKKWGFEHNGLNIIATK